MEKGLPPSPGVTAQPVLGMLGYYTPHCSRAPGLTVGGHITPHAKLKFPRVLELFHRRFPCEQRPELPYLRVTVKTACRRKASPLVICAREPSQGLTESVQYVAGLHIAPVVGVNCEKQLVKTGWPLSLIRVHVIYQGLVAGFRSALGVCCQSRGCLAGRFPSSLPSQPLSLCHYFLSLATASAQTATVVLHIW